MRLLKVSALLVLVLFNAILLLGIVSLYGLQARGGGGTPGATVNGDVNCDGQIDISDAVAIIEWQFRGGAAPCALAQDNFATKDDLSALATRVAALEALNRNDAKVATGTYIGNGTASRSIQTGLTGKLRYLTVKRIDAGFPQSVWDVSPDPNVLDLNGADFVVNLAGFNNSGLKYAWIALSTVE